MTNHTKAKREKEEVRARIRRTVGPTYPPNRRRKDWLVTTDDNTSVFITFSQAGHLFYDVDVDDLREWTGSYDQAFVVFVLGTKREVLVVPASKLQSAIQSHRLEPKGRNDYKLHVTTGPSGEYIFRETPTLDLTPFHNNYNVIENARVA